jgi:hypothetical protein
MHYAVVHFHLVIMDGQDGYIGKHNTLRMIEHASAAIYRGRRFSPEPLITPQKLLSLFLHSSSLPSFDTAHPNHCTPSSPTARSTWGRILGHRESQPQVTQQHRPSVLETLELERGSRSGNNSTAHSEYFRIG